MPSPSSFGKTPESYFAGLRRKDSKHALTTCHGVTSNGRACRRPIAAQASPNNRYTIKGAILVPNNDEDPALFYCWQHKDQAESLRTQDVEVVDVQERSSLETVFRNLGLEEVEEEPEEAVSPSPIVRHQERRKPSVQHDTAVRGNGEKRNIPHVNFAPATDTEPRQPRRNRDARSRPKTEEALKSPYPKTAPPRRPGLMSLLFSCLKDQQPSERDLQPPRPRNRRRHSDSALPSRRIDRMSSSPNANGTESRTGKYNSSTSVPRATGIPRKPVGNRNSQPNRSQGKAGDVGVAEARQTNGTDPSTPRHSPRRDSGVGEQAERRKPQARASDPSQRRRARGQEPGRKKDTLGVYRDPAPNPDARTPYLRPPFSQSESRQPLTDRPQLSNRSNSAPERSQVSAEWMPAAPPNPTDVMRICYAKLLTTMSEAPTKSDDEGYIYLFWQTETEQTDAETTAAASIVSANLATQQAQEKILQKRFFQAPSANAAAAAAEQRTIFLKIGKAGNVHQRMNQWQAQCGYDISLLRYYPHDAEECLARKVKYVGKVERLIHLNLEMLGKRIKKECRCGTEHKEWFEVGANPHAVREVDGIIRQWVAWSDSRFGAVAEPK